VRAVWLAARTSTGLASVVLSRRFCSGIQIACDHNTNCFDPTGNIADRIEAALGDRLVVGGISAATGMCCLALSGIVKPEILEALIVL